MASEDTPGASVPLGGETWSVLRLLGSGKAGHAWLVSSGESLRVLKRMHDEETEHYRFGDKVLDEVSAYERLVSTGIAMPKILAWSREERWILKEYAEGPTAAELAARGSLEAGHWKAILELHRRLKEAGFHVDYFPTNFVWDGRDMVLIDYEGHPWNREWDFPNWGIFYWLNAEGMREHLEKGASERLNLPGRPKPVWEPFLARRNEILAAFGFPPEPDPETLWTR